MTVSSRSAIRSRPSHEPPDLVVGVLEERRERLLEAGGEPALRLGQLVPRVDAGVAGRQVGAGRDHTEFLLPGEPTPPRLVPTVVVAAAVASEVLRGRLVRRVGGAEREVREERSVGPDRHRVVDELERLSTRSSVRW